MKILAFALLVALAAGLGYVLARGQRDSAAVAAARDTMQVIVYQRDTVRVTIRIRERARRRVDSVCCTIVTDTQLVIVPGPSAPPETVTVRAPVVERIRTDSLLIAGLYADRRLDSLWHIQDAKLPHKAPSKWGLGLAAGYACSPKGCGPGVSIGLVWRP